MTIHHTDAGYVVECPVCHAGIAHPLLIVAQTWRDTHVCRKAKP